MRVLRAAEKLQSVRKEGGNAKSAFRGACVELQGSRRVGLSHSEIKTGMFLRDLNIDLDHSSCGCQTEQCPR
jgi:hypothetical protein